jgi:hypothetical protein
VAEDEDEDEDEDGEDDSLLVGPVLSFDPLSDVLDELAVLGPLADELEARESVMYQPLPLNTMPTGWMTLRNVPPHCSQVVRGGSEKLWRFSMTSLHAVQV